MKQQQGWRLSMIRRAQAPASAVKLSCSVQQPTAPTVTQLQLGDWGQFDG